MPSTINGIGTRYFGRKNVDKSSGVCSSCGRPADLLTYETRLWFCVLYIPVIPLGRKQILDFCPLCTTHRAVPIDQWEKLRSESITASRNAMQETPDDPKAGLEMLGTLAAFRKNEEATKLARILVKRHGDNAEVQFVVASWFEQVNMADEAIPSFRRAWELEPDNLQYRRAWGVTEAQQGRLNDACDLLSFMKPPSEHFDIGTWVYVAGLMQQQGDHERALENFKDVLGAVPELGRDKNLRRMINQSESACAVDESMLPGRSLFSSGIVKWAAALLLLAGLFSIASFTIASQHGVHVVNGAEVPITVLIDGHDVVAVPPLGHAFVTTGGGAHQWQVTEPESLAGNGEFTLSSGFFERVFMSPAWVLDPGQTTITTFETVVYAAHAEDSQASRTYYPGRVFSAHDDVDFVFEEFPDSIQIEGNNATRTRVGMLQIEPAVAMGVLSRELDPQLLISMCERHLQATPQKDTLLDVYTLLTARTDSFDRMYETLKKGVGRRPVEITWHRHYQQAAAEAGRAQGLLEEYDRLVADNPDSAGAYYLRGRIEPDGDRADEFFTQAIEKDPQLPWPWFARSYRQMSLAEYEAARTSIARALELQDDESDLHRMRFVVRLVLGEGEALIQEARAALSANDLDFTSHFQLLSVLSTLDRTEELKAQVAAFSQSIRTKFPLDPFEAIKLSERFQAWHEGDFEQMLMLSRSLAENPQKQELIVEALIAGDLLEDAADHVEGSAGAQPGISKLQLSAGYLKRADLQQAEHWLKAALEDFRGGSNEKQAVVAAFETRQGQELFDSLRRVSVPVDERLLLCLAGAMRTSGDVRNEFLSFAEKLNIEPSFPQDLARDAIVRMRASGD